MRWQLLNFFSSIYILDLHGFYLHKFKEKDENIFNIKKGVCISFFIKQESKTGTDHVNCPDFNTDTHIIIPTIK